VCGASCLKLAAWPRWFPEERPPEGGHAKASYLETPQCSLAGAMRRRAQNGRQGTAFSRGMPTPTRTKNAVTTCDAPQLTCVEPLTGEK